MDTPDTAQVAVDAHNLAVALELVRRAKEALRLHGILQAETKAFWDAALWGNQRAKQQHGRNVVTVHIAEVDLRSSLTRYLDEQAALSPAIAALLAQDQVSALLRSLPPVQPLPDDIREAYAPIKDRKPS